jgi:hypothetical protein
MKKLLIPLLLILCGALTAQTFGKNKVNARPQDWSLIKTMHFDIYFPRGEDDFGRTVSLMAEDIYYYLKEDLKYPALSRIPLVFYGSKSEFQTTNIIYPLLTEGVGGFTESLRNRVVVPFDGDYAELEKLLAHELTHAYINGLDNRLSTAVEALRPTSFPFWFSEGLPEYLSIGGKDPYNNMFILDLVVNDKLPRLDYLDGYLAYRLGESFLSYLSATYGREKVSEYFFSLRSMNSIDDATERVFAMKFEDLESRWRYQLKRDFFPLINSYKVPIEAFEKRTDRGKEGSYFNFNPRFSPDGSRYVYYSDRGARFSIWMAGTHGMEKARKLITGETNAKMEEFYYFRSSLSWFPDGKRIAYAAKTARGDRIHILDVETGKITKSIAIDDLTAIYESDVAPDGKSIVLAAQRGLQSDIFIYELDSGVLRSITDDSYHDSQPRFSPDGTRIVFTSERSRNAPDQRFGFFADLTKDIFEYRLQSSEIVQITDEAFDCSMPFYAENGSKVVYISNREGIANLEIIDPEAGQRAELSRVISGIYSADISADANYMLVSNYFSEGWDIYFDNSPLKDLNYQPSPAAKPYQMAADLLDGVDMSRLDWFGPRKRTPTPRRNPAAGVNVRRPVFSGFEPVIPDTSLIASDYSWDQRPSEPSEEIPRVRNYRPRFTLDRVWGGAAYSTGGGAVGSVELGLSDIMGDHAIGLNLGITDVLSQTNFLLTYLYLKRRLDVGIGVYNFYDESYYRSLESWGYDYYRLRERQTGLYGLTRYPFSRFARLELDGMLYDYERHWDYLHNSHIDDGNWLNNVEHFNDIAFTPGISLVYDNALFGSTGPLVGTRAYLNIRKGFADKHLDYLTNYIDVRSYNLFSKRYSIALRANAGISTGKYPDRFSLGGYYGVRALSHNLSGEKKVLASAELRFPLLDYFALAFPIPLTLGNIRGSAFVDVGSVWDDNKYFRGMRDGLMEDIKLGYGFGPRLNLGYFVLKLDVAWLTDLSSISKPQVYLSLSDDF